MDTSVTIHGNHKVCTRDPMIYGHFIEHFHRQIYGGVYDPKSPFADADGLRTDVLEAMRRIRVPVLRWPGGCFVSSYHWQKGVGPDRVPFFDKAWRVEDPNEFGTNEFVAMCRKIGCEPYICTNAGTGTAEEMSDWVEYCNLENQGEFARMRISHGIPKPHGVRYWSIGNENYGSWEIGAKDAEEWGRLVLEAAKMMKHVDPSVELSAATIADLDWNVSLLKAAGPQLDWISIHKYWNLMAENNTFFTYEQSMACTNDLDTEIRQVRGLLTAMGLEKRIRVAYDEWNLRGWHHPNVHAGQLSNDPASYLTPRDLNDRNQDYTMADAVFTACFLNTLNRNADIIGMANFAPIVNTRGCIYTYDGGIVLRSTYHVFDLYVNRLGDEILEMWDEKVPTFRARAADGHIEEVTALDILPTRRSDTGTYAIAVVNKHPTQVQTLNLNLSKLKASFWRLVSVLGDSTESYNDVGVQGVRTVEDSWMMAGRLDMLQVDLQPHSVNVIELRA